MFSYLNKNKDIVSVTLLVLALAFMYQGSRALWEPDEGSFGAVGAEMYDDGDWLIPRLNHQVYLEKPPVMYWGMIAGFKLLGRNEWGVRVFFGLCYALTVCAVGAIAMSFWGRRDAVLASLVYATTAVPFVAGNVARPDTPLALFTTLTLYFFWKSLTAKGNVSAVWKLLMCAAIGVGVLCKGPAALIPTGALFLYLIIAGRIKEFFFTLWAIPCFLIFSAVALPWYFFVARSVPGSASYLWDNYVYGRLISTKYARHPGLGGIIDAYALPLTLGLLPWVLAWPVIFLRRGKDTWQARPFQLLRNLRHHTVALLLFLWIGVQLLILFLSSSKLPLYVLPVFPAIALITARSLVLSLGDKKLPLYVTGAILAWSIAMVAAKAISANVESSNLEFLRRSAVKDTRYLAREINAVLPAGYTTILAVDETLDGLSFYYSDKKIIPVSSDGNSYPSFQKKPRLDAQLAALKNEPRLAIVTSSHGIAHRLQPVRDIVSAANRTYDDVELPFGRRLLLCK